MTKHTLPLFSLLCLLSACAPEPAPLAVEVRNDWAQPDNFTVDVRPLGGTESIALDALTVYPGEVRAAWTRARVTPGTDVEFRVRQVVAEETTNWRGFYVPERAAHEDGVLFRVHLATDKSEPACTAPHTTCILGSWERQSWPPEAF